MESPPFQPDRVERRDAPAWSGGVSLLVGGSFDPVHEAHVRLSDEARRLALEGRGEIVFVPASRSPHKALGPRASDRERVEMLGLGALAIDGWSIWRAELDRSALGEPSYWIDTLRQAREAGAGELRFLIGADQAVAFHRWREARAILELAHPVVAPRAEIGDAETLAGAVGGTGAWSDAEVEAWRGWFVPTSVCDVSATAIRAALADPARREGPIEGLDPRVHRYILERGLYRSGDGLAGDE
ncbi:MAG: nicotinate-nicotinamide nucleotide adenylyltransferase [Phycisphaerales bacterium JB059]